MSDTSFVQNGPFTGVRYDPSFRSSLRVFKDIPGMHGFVAFSDSVTWSAFAVGVNQRMPADVIDMARNLRWTSAQSLGHMPIDARILYRWAFEGVQKRKAMTIFAEPALAKPANVTLLAPGGVTLVSRGYDLVVGRNLTRSEQDILALVVKTIGMVQPIWGWAPAPLLEIQYHDETWKALGAAFDSSRNGPNPSERKMSLRRDLVREYDDNSVIRLLKHELCHFYRDERFPLSYDAHDARFVECLRQVDPEIGANPKFFSGEIAAVIKAQEAKKADRVVWTADAGQLHVNRTKAGDLRLFWEPKVEVPKSHRWRAVSISARDEDLREFARRFSRGDRARTTVVYEERAVIYRLSLARAVKLQEADLMWLHNFLLAFSAYHGRKLTLDFLVQEAQPCPVP